MAEVEKEKPADAMTRAEMIYALRKYCHPDWYQKILVRSNVWLREVLTVYQNESVTH